MAAPKRTGLGRGIGALIPGAEGDDTAGRPVDVFFPAASSDRPALLAVPGARLANLSPDDIAPNAQQPRKEFGQDESDATVRPVEEVENYLQ